MWLRDSGEKSLSPDSAVDGSTVECCSGNFSPVLAAGSWVKLIIMV